MTVKSHRRAVSELAPLIDTSAQVESFRQAREARRVELVEDYIELIADLIADGGEARQVDIAARLGVAQPTVAKMLKRLVEEGLIFSKALPRRFPHPARPRSRRAQPRAPPAGRNLSAGARGRSRHGPAVCRRHRAPCERGDFERFRELHRAARERLSAGGQTGSCRALRGGDGSRHSRCRFRVLQKPILGTADSEYWHCLGVRSFLLEIPQASMNKARGLFCSPYELGPLCSTVGYHAQASTPDPEVNSRPRRPGQGTRSGRDRTSAPCATDDRPLSGTLMQMVDWESPRVRQRPAA